MITPIQLNDETLEMFRLSLLEQEKSPSTIEKYMRDVRHFLDYAGNSPIDKALLLHYKEQLSLHYAAASANSMIASVNSFLRFGQQGNLCLRQLRVQHQAYMSKEKELSRAEYVRLIRTADRWGDMRLMMIIQTICATGIRVSELEFITVEAAMRGEAIVRCKGKTRTVFLVHALCNRLLYYAHERNLHTGPLFVTRTGRPVNRTFVWRQMKELCEAAHVPPQKVFPHNLRHLFARTFYDLEKDIAKLADVLGHASINTTRIYIATSGAEHREKMEQMKLVI